MVDSSKWRRMAPLGGKWSNVAVESRGGAVWRVMLSGSGEQMYFFSLSFSRLIEKITLSLLYPVFLGCGGGGGELLGAS